MALTPETALHRLKLLYRDANHCDPPTEAHVIRWAQKPELWATHKIRHSEWSWQAAEAVVRECRRLIRRAQQANITPGQDPYDPLMPNEEPKA
ncbi:MAG: hypothetical protein RLZZ32_1425 [Cyanobacteriota bacterium]|jgi:hypothetical protein